jgi:hypothetical protein
LRRLARQWQLRIRTVARDDRVGVMRIDEQPWDDDERAAIQRVNDALADTFRGPWAAPTPRRQNDRPR